MNFDNITCLELGDRHTRYFYFNYLFINYIWGKKSLDDKIDNFFVTSTTPANGHDGVPVLYW